MAFEKFKSGLSLFFQSCAFFIVFFMLMRVGLQTVHHAPVIQSPLLEVVPIEMRNSSQVLDSAYLKSSEEPPLALRWNEEGEAVKVEAPKSIAMAEDKLEDFDVQVLVKKRIQNGLPLISVSVSKSFEAKEKEVIEKVETKKTMTEMTLGNPFTIQLVTYRSQSRAEEEVLNLQEAGFNSFIIPSGEFFQVCVNRFNEKSVAIQTLDEFRSRQLFHSYQDAFVRPVMR